MMQIGMVLGFFTSYPVNIFLIKAGWKEKMPQDKNETKKTMRREQFGQERAARARAATIDSPVLILFFS